MRRKTWGDWADHVLQEVVEEWQQQRGTPEELRRMMRDAYPFGERDHWPYKVWLVRQRAWFTYATTGSWPVSKRIGQYQRQQAAAGQQRLDL